MAKFVSRDGLLIFVLLEYGCAHLDRYGHKNVAIGKDLEFTIRTLSASYLDPRKIEPQKMMLEALFQMENEIPEMRVHPHLENSQVQIEIGPDAQRFLLPSAGALSAEKSKKLSPAIVSLQKSLVGALNFILAHVGNDARQNWKQVLEYRAIDGILSTLDPHTQTDMNDLASRLVRAEFSHEKVFAPIWPRFLLIEGERFNFELKKTPEALRIDKVFGNFSEETGFREGDEIRLIAGYDPRNMLGTEIQFLLHTWKENSLPICVRSKDSNIDRCLSLQAEKIRYQISSVYGQFNPQDQQKIAYIHIHKFSSNETKKNFKSILTKFLNLGMCSLILDLRDNMGGDAGPTESILATLTQDWTLTARLDHRFDAVPRTSSFPIVVLVNSRSASAAELLAGSLKATGRAIVMGLTSMGKGVATDYFRLPDFATVKFTFTEVLMPQFGSIQAVGIVPDIEVKPLYISDPDFLSLDPVLTWESERDLPNHVNSSYQLEDQESYGTLHYFETSGKINRPDLKKELADWMVPLTAPPSGMPPELFTDCSFHPEDCAHDEVSNIARKVLANTHSFRREEMLRQVVPFLKQQEKTQEQQLQSTLQSYGIDWAFVGEQKAPVKLQVRSWVANDVKSGGSADWVVEVTNQGLGTAGHVRVQLRSEELWLHGKEWIFGKILPGETNIKHIQVPIPGYLPACAHVGTLQIFEEHQASPLEQFVHVDLKSPSKPQFAYHYELINSQNSLDGKIVPGEIVHLRVTVKNLGKGISPAPRMLLENLNTKGVLATVGRHDLEPLLPNQEITRDFEIATDTNYSQSQAWFRLYLGDPEVLEDPLTAEISFPIRPYAKGTVIYDQVFSSKWKGESVHLSIGEYPVFTEQENFSLEVLVEHSISIQDAYVTLSSPRQPTRKVHYQKNAVGSKQMKIQTNLTLRPGINQITVVARHSTDTMIARKIWVIYRPPSSKS